MYLPIPAERFSFSEGCRTSVNYIILGGCSDGKQKRIFRLKRPTNGQTDFDLCN